MINNILINTETRNLKAKDYDFLGIAGENDIEQIVFKLSAFIDGEAILEIEKYNTKNEIEKYFITLDKQDESYVFNVKNSLLDVAKPINMQLHITTENTEVFKSKKFTMKVYEAINATETVPEQYAEWIDIANSTIARINKLEETISTNEAVREKSETERNIAETIRITNESIRTENEQDRESNELDRIDNEEIRQTNESNRIEAEENREKITAEAVENIKDLSESYEQLAEEKTAELNEIADGVKDMATAIQFATFKVNKTNMHLQIITAKKMGNTSFTLNKKNGRLGVRIINGK